MSLEDLKEPPNFNPKPHFSFLVTELFTKLDLVNKDNLRNFTSITAKKQFIIDEFIKNWKHYVGLNIYPAARLIFPARDGRLYFIRDVGLSRLITKMYKIPKNSIDFRRVNDWKRNYHDYKKLNTDKKRLRTLSYILAQQISERRDVQPKGDEVTIQEVNDVLDKLASDEVESGSQQIELLEPFMRKLNTEELRWFLQIILKDATISPMESYFYRSWHPDAPQFSNVVNNLRAVFWRLTDITERLSESDLRVHLMYPFLPQLAAKPKLSYEEIASRMGNNFYIEEKIDGDRMIMHMKRNSEDKNDMHFKYYTRRCRDYSLLYGEDLKNGAMSKYLRYAFHEGVSSCVLDGEMVAWDYRRNVILPFGTLKASAVQEAVRHFTTEDAFSDQSAWPLFIIYDILYLNGVHLVGTKLIERRNALKRIIIEIPHRFELLETPIAHTAQDIEDAMKKTVLERSEGVMLKNVNSKYKIAQRDNSWVKVKPEYLEQFGENLDLVVIGVIKGVKNAYMCALKDTSDGDIYKSFCTVGNGFSNSEYDEIRRITEGKWHDYKTEPPPPDKVLFGSRKPDQWIYPEDSLVIEIKARSIDSELLGTYAVGNTLHNLYCRRLRLDKSYEECVTLQEYKEMKELNSMDAAKAQEVIKGNKQLGVKPSKENRLLGDAIAIKNVKVVSTLFKGLKFIILSGKVDSKTGDRISDTDIIKVVKKHGGIICTNVEPQSVVDRKIICVSEVLTVKSKQMLKIGIDLISPEWIFQCIRYNSILPIEPSLIFRSSSDKLVETSKRRLDEYGDSYILHVDEPIQKYAKRLHIVKEEGGAANRQGLVTLQTNASADFKSAGVDDSPIAYLFKDVKFYIVSLQSTPSWQTEGLERKIKRYFGEVTLALEDASFVVFTAFDKYDFAADQEGRRKAKEISSRISNEWSRSKKIPYIVDESFVDESIRNKVLVDPQDYKV
ncbi:DNA ligase 4 [[Candida] railenensis]|uniref:DNA ligase 4 n=1 Tax=[Candida] railenensis TaxID=45579 RepID=A0A9P0VXQ5_9ASCO|nr:DNA ligase 4 [[Candida] railenensis]